MCLSIAEFAKATGLSAHTLRYYEKEGLLVVGRNDSGHRSYTEQDVTWMAFIKRLKDTGMPIKGICEYAALRYQGDRTLERRLAILEEHRINVRRAKEELESHLLNLDDKIEIYKGLLKGGIEW